MTSLVRAVSKRLGKAGSLVDFRDWLAGPAVGDLDIRPLADSLGLALAAVFLRGWDDAGGNRAIQFAEGDAVQPFAEQVDFFRRKMKLKTATWTDIWQSQHDVAFVVAGAAQESLLNDLHKAVDAAIADGETIASFRKRFDATVKRHGWAYNGGRNWRTRVIYDTNIRTSYAAGRWEQMQSVKDTRPWWRYRHSHASENPRDLHLQWDRQNLVLRHDNKWWQTHYPPNGWGCKCYVETLSEKGLERLRGQVEARGGKVRDRAPPARNRTVTVGKRGPNPRPVTVPAGIDPGFAYAPGEAVSARESRLVGEMGREDFESLREATRKIAGSRKTPAGTLTPAERVILYESTLNMRDQSKALRERPIGVLDETSGMTMTYNAALDKLPDHRGTVRRGLHLDGDDLDAFLARHARGGTVIYNGFTHSTTRSRIKDFSVELVMVSRHGKRIAPWSAYPAEDEVAFKLGTAFRVVRAHEENGKHIIHLAEIVDE